ncbi:MAG: FeoA family protein [Bacteroidota bacterium]|nr:FeoA family protein [Bacteroidota bacterium]MDP4234025.1 FeoA family protein [Bacteroidota bacterium]MDP4242891.1 FeoA family protein [Bacteroidota bacterium]MDP4287670.1 FeoA family protein [Bacteroidota bacterium]
MLARIPEIFRGRRRHAVALGASVAITTSATAHLHFDPHVRKPRMTLADLHEGDSATIKTIVGTTSAQLHLMEMGLTPGTTVRVVRLAIFGGPLDILVRGYRLSLRREEAQAIQLLSSH